jgi:hypothetical protein
LLENSKSFYIERGEGDVVAVEIYEHHGKITVEIGDGFVMTIDAHDAFDIADALVMVANDVDSHTGGE